MTEREPSSSGAPTKPAPTREDVAARLAAVQEQHTAVEQARMRRKDNAKGAGIAMRIGIELVAAVLVGVGLGWFLDKQFNTSPIFLLALTPLAFTAGVLNVIRIAKGMDDRPGLGRSGPKNNKGAPVAPANDT